MKGAQQSDVFHGFTSNTALLPISCGHCFTVSIRHSELVIRSCRGKVSSVLPTYHVADGNPRQSLMVLPDLWPVPEIPLTLCL